MDNNILSFFEIINKKGYVKSLYNNQSNGASITFKHLLAQNNILDDYNIRITSLFSLRWIILFNESINSDNLYVGEKYNINRITPSFLKIKQHNEYKCLLRINYFEKKIYFEFYDNKLMLLEQIELIDLVKVKNYISELKYIYILYTRNKLTKNDYYFHFYKIECLELISYENLIQSLIEGKVTITLDFKKDNIIFSVSKKNILSAYKRIYVYGNNKN